MQHQGCAAHAARGEGWGGRRHWRIHPSLEAPWVWLWHHGTKLKPSERPVAKKGAKEEGLQGGKKPPEAVSTRQG